MSRKKRCSVIRRRLGFATKKKEQLKIERGLLFKAERELREAKKGSDKEKIAFLEEKIGRLKGAIRTLE